MLFNFSDSDSENSTDVAQHRVSKRAKTKRTRATAGVVANASPSDLGIPSPAVETDMDENNELLESVLRQIASVANYSH